MSGSKGQNDDGQSQTSFILEAQDRTQDTMEDSNKSNSDPLKSAKLRTVCLSLMTTMMGIAIGVSSTWPYMQKIEPTVDPKFYGWTFVGFNLAAIIGDFTFGACIHFRPSREPLIGSLFVTVLSAVIFAFAQGIGGIPGLWAVLISRLLLGFTRGILTVTRTIMSESTSTADRSSAMASLIIAMSCGFASGSGIQAAVALIGERSIYIKSIKLYINLYTITALWLIFASIITQALIARFVKPTPKPPRSNTPTEIITRQGKSDVVIVRLCLLVMFSLVNFSLSFMESLLIPFIQHQFALSKPDAVRYGGIFFMSQGIIGLSVQILMIRVLFKRFSDRFLVSIAYSCLVLNFFLYIPFGNKKMKLQGTFGDSHLNSTKYYVANGCPRKFDWCHDTPQIWLPQFILGAILFSFGYSSCLGLFVSLYTKLVSSKNKSSNVSFISACGNFGRLVAPIVATASYVDIGPQYTFAWICSLLSVTLLAFFCLYGRMVPPEGDINFKQEEEICNQVDVLPVDNIQLVTPV